MASEEDLLRVHTPEHVRGIREACDEASLGSGSLVEIDPDTRVSPASWSAALGSAGGAIEACRAVAAGEMPNAFVATRPPGHHATPDRAMGFCLFNNVAIAARALQASGAAERVLIVDWDVHHGNGTQDAFYEDPSVFFLSLHQSPWYPGTGAAHERGRGEGEGYTLNVPLAAGTPRDVHRSVFRESLREAESRFDPDFILISSGFDAMAGDPLGGLLLEPEDFHGMANEVKSLAEDRCDGRVVALLEGGYDPRRMALGVVAVIRALAGVSLAEAPTPFSAERT
jgi:acetoin utilization deacetylase AcuC-like enzyme